MFSVFNRNNNRLSEHFDICRQIFQFYRSHDLIIGANKPLVKLLENSLLFCLRSRYIFLLGFNSIKK